MRWLAYIQSVLAALFGVQSEQKRMQDFAKHHPFPLIVIALGTFVLFVLMILAIVFAVLPQST